MCTLPIKCLRCAGPHQVKECPTPFDSPMQCANCGDNHASNYRQCPKNPANSAKLRSALKNNNHRTQNIQINNPRQFPAIAQRVRPNVSFSHALAGQNTESALSDLPSPANPPQTQDFSCTDTLRAVMELSREISNKKLLVIAFKNVLPQLRTAKSGVDRAYLIFESYIHLESSQGPSP